jgi:hypothetical protein
MYMLNKNTQLARQLKQERTDQVNRLVAKFEAKPGMAQKDVDRSWEVPVVVAGLEIGPLATRAAAGLELPDVSEARESSPPKDNGQGIIPRSRQLVH